MVGVLRSKACNACRARRKKCDEQRPVCGACSRRGVNCVYRSDINFVFFQPPSTRSDNGASDDTTSEEDARSVSHTVSRQQSPFDLPHGLLLTANASQAHGYFLDNFLPRSTRSSQLGSDTGPIAATLWYSAAADLAQQDPLLNDALLALSLKYAEQRHGQKTAAEHGQMVYSRVTKNLSHRLSSKNDSLRDSTLAAVMALTTWETQAADSTGASGWMAHVKGAIMLVRLRGNANFDTDFGRKLYLGSLLSNLVGAIGTRKALPPSTITPTDHIHGPFASYARLFQVLNAMPAILEQCDIVNTATVQKASSSDIAGKASIMVYMCRDFETRLSEWNSQFLQEHDNQILFWKEPSELYARLPIDSPNRIFSECLSFRSLDVAQQLVFGWACLLLVHLALATNVKTLAENGYSDITVYATDYDSMTIFQKLYKLAMDILMSLEYFVHPDMGMTGIDFLGLPINLVYGFLKPRDFHEVLWFEVIFARIREMNPAFSEFLEAMARQGGGGRAYKMLVLNKLDVPLVKKPYSDTTAKIVSG